LLCALSLIYNPSHKLGTDIKVKEQSTIPLSKLEKEYQQLKEKAERLSRIRPAWIGALVADQWLRMAEGKKAIIEEQQGVGLGKNTKCTSHCYLSCSPVL
jgi:hypothetical protein